MTPDATHVHLRLDTYGYCRGCGVRVLTSYLGHKLPDRPAVHRFRPCEVCGLSPDVHNTNRGPGEFVGHEYR